MQYKWEPNEDQKTAIEAPVTGVLRLISGPGSGKTFVQEHRYAFLVENGVNPDNILLVVFNRQNADEMKERVQKLVSQTNGQWITTIHAACYRIFKADDEAFPAGHQYQVVQPTTWLKRDKFSIKSFIVDMTEDFWPNPDNRPGWKEVWAWIGTSKMNGLTPAESGEFLTNALGEYHGDRVYQITVALWRRMKALKVLTFADMLLLIDVTLKRDPAFRARWQHQFTHVLVDEGQDVSEQAMRILATLAEPQKNLFLVGDQDQLLYRFAGATPEANLFDGFEQRYPDGATVMMGTNYRSTNSLIIDRAKTLIAHNYTDADGPYDQKYMKDLQPMPGAEPGAEITFNAYATAEEEANAVADGIAALLTGTEDGDGFATDGREPGDFFVGARTKAQLGYLEGPLMLREIPFINVTGGSFWESRHVADVVAYLRLAHDGGDADAFKRVYNVASNWMTVPWKKSPHYGEYCAHRFLGAAFLRDSHETFTGALQAVRGRDGWRYKTGVEDLETLLYGIQDNMESPADGIKFIIDNCYEKYLRASEGLIETDEAENGKLEDLKTALDIAGNYGTIEEFLTYVFDCVKAAEDARNGDWSDYVIISTVHRLKGLERPVVFGVGWCEGYIEDKKGNTEPRGLLPHTFSLMPPPQIGVLPGSGMSRVEDERCLAFVLTTRAKEEVYLSYPKEYRGAMMGPSRFAVEMGLTEEPAPKPNQGDAAVEALFEKVLTDEERDQKEDFGTGQEVDWDNFNQSTQNEESPITDEDVRAGMKALFPTAEDVLAMFPSPGRPERGIIRFAAKEITAAFPDFEPTIENSQLVLRKQIVGDVSMAVFTSVMAGEIAGAKGEDSIRVVLKEGDRYSKKGKWITRQYPTRIAADRRWAYGDCAAHVFGKVRDKVAELADGVRECPGCGAAQVKLTSKSQKNPDRPFWKCRGCGMFQWADSQGGD